MSTAPERCAHRIPSSTAAALYAEPSSPTHRLLHHSASPVSCAPPRGACDDSPMEYGLSLTVRGGTRLRLVRCITGAKGQCAEHPRANGPHVAGVVHRSGGRHPCVGRHGVPLCDMVSHVRQGVRLLSPAKLPPLSGLRVHGGKRGGHDDVFQRHDRMHNLVYNATEACLERYAARPQEGGTSTEESVNIPYRDGSQRRREMVTRQSSS
jgi:hypothetical protein